MYIIEYEIKINESGRPYIHLPEEYNDIPENRFFAMEITRYILNGVLDSNNSKLNETTKMKIAEAGMLIGQVADEVAVLLKGQMKHTTEIDKITKAEYDTYVNDIEELHNLNQEGFIRHGKIFKKVEGLKVMVLETMDVYEYQGGNDPENWKIL